MGDSGTAVEHARRINPASHPQHRTPRPLLGRRRPRLPPRCCATPPRASCRACTTSRGARARRSDKPHARPEVSASISGDPDGAVYIEDLLRPGTATGGRVYPMGNSTNRIHVWLRTKAHPAADLKSRDRRKRATRVLSCPVWSLVRVPRSRRADGDYGAAGRYARSQPSLAGELARHPRPLSGVTPMVVLRHRRPPGPHRLRRRRLTFGGNIIETGTDSYRLAHSRALVEQHSKPNTCRP